MHRSEMRDFAMIILICMYVMSLKWESETRCKGIILLANVNEFESGLSDENYLDYE